MKNILLLLTWCFISLSSCLYNVDQERAPQGPLGVRLDYPLVLRKSGGRPNADGQKKRNILFSSHLIFKEKVESITDGQLWQIAQDAFQEMIVGRAGYGFDEADEQPNAMGVMAWGNEILLVSSQKGKLNYVQTQGKTPATKSLETCQNVWERKNPSTTAKGHWKGGSCAEIAAAHLYYILQQRTPGNAPQKPLAEQNTRIAVVTRRGQDPGSYRYDPTPPCGDSKDRDGRPRDVWGCNVFIEVNKMYPLAETTPARPYDLSTLAGGLIRYDQVRLCGSLKSPDLAGAGPSIG